MTAWPWTGEGLSTFAASLRMHRAHVHAVKIYGTCIGCTQCVRACPLDVLEMVPRTAMQAGLGTSSPRTEDCVGCKRCETACPTGFLSIRVYLGARPPAPWVSPTDCLIPPHKLGRRRRAFFFVRESLPWWVPEKRHLSFWRACGG